MASGFFETYETVWILMVVFFLILLGGSVFAMNEFERDSAVHIEKIDSADGEVVSFDELSTLEQSIIEEKEEKIKSSEIPITLTENESAFQDVDYIQYDGNVYELQVLPIGNMPTSYAMLLIVTCFSFSGVVIFSGIGILIVLKNTWVRFSRYIRKPKTE